ncbi:hypothetical protein ACFCP7_01550 [Paenibacillus elgii]
MPKKPSRTTFISVWIIWLHSSEKTSSAASSPLENTCHLRWSSAKQYQLSKNSVRKGLDMLVDEQVDREGTEKSAIG